MAVRSAIQIIDSSREFLARELFFSTTTRKGIIDYGNEVFVRISGYTEDEVVGAAHSIVRHPDMPRGVFHLFWQTIQAGETIAAYVKNLAKDGRYYWVFAVAGPCEGGYLSVRLKPTSDLLPLVESIYAEMRLAEHCPSGSSETLDARLQASRERLNELLAANGFATYEAFMRHALSVEMVSRQRILAAERQIDSGYSSFGVETHAGSFETLLGINEQFDRELQQLFDRLDDFKALNQTLLAGSTAMLASASNIRVLALNATVAAARLSGKAATLGVIAQSLGEASHESQTIISLLIGTMKQVVAMIDELIFDVATAKLQTEVSITFLREIVSGTSVESPPLRRSLDALQREVIQRSTRVYDSLATAEKFFTDLELVMLDLTRNNYTLKFVQVAGHKEAATLDEAGGFAVLLRDVQAEIDTTQSQCHLLRQSVNNGLDHVKKIRSRQDEAERALEQIRTWLQGITVEASLSELLFT